MPLYQALILGLVQGLTEFLPISSSAHLVLVPFMFGWDEPSVAFDVAVHAGTLISVLYVFWDRFKPMLRALVQKDEPNRHMLTLLFIGTIPAAVIGLAFTKFLEKAFERPVMTAIELGITGWLMFVGDRIINENEERVREEQLAHRRAVALNEPAPQVRPLREEQDIEPLDAVLVGAAQAASILPGISRSGATVVAAVKLGISREAAVRFSFLLSIPAIAGAILVQLPDMIKESSGGMLLPMIVGVVAAGVSGVIAIRGFIAAFQKRGLKQFGVYCFLLMTAGLLTALARG